MTPLKRRESIHEDIPPSPKHRVKKMWYILLCMMPLFLYFYYNYISQYHQLRERTDGMEPNQGVRKRVKPYLGAPGVVLRSFNSKLDESNKPYCLFPTWDGKSTEFVPLLNKNKQLNNGSWLARQVKTIKPGGHYTPAYCRSRRKVAILVPYRDRKENLDLFLLNIHPFLIIQHLEYRIFIIEQYGKADFNRGILLNIGFEESKKIGDFNCLIFHDVDLLPLNKLNYYTCQLGPVHMCTAIWERKYDPAFHSFFGGVSAMLPEHFISTNGFSNKYWGWGAEDTDMYFRILYQRLSVMNVVESIGVYTTLRHPAAKANERRHLLLNRVHERITEDGLSSLRYSLMSLIMEPLYTHILVDIGIEDPTTSTTEDANITDPETIANDIKYSTENTVNR